MTVLIFYFYAKICTFFFCQVDNFIHADMHPGNILVRVYRCKSPSKQLFRLRPHVVFLDVGMTAELSKRDQLNLVEFFKAVAVRDGRTVAECTLRLSGQQDCPNPRAFIEVMHSCIAFMVGGKMLILVIENLRLLKLSLLPLR